MAAKVGANEGSIGQPFDATSGFVYETNKELYVQFNPITGELTLIG